MVEKQKRIVTEENIDDLIGEWHDGETGLNLFDFLGWTEKQYAHWVETGNIPTNIK